jgi:hypothetical protein
MVLKLQYSIPLYFLLIFNSCRAHEKEVEGLYFNESWYKDSLGCNGKRDFHQVMLNKDAYINCSLDQILLMFGEPNYIDTQKTVITYFSYGSFECENKDSLKINRKARASANLFPEARLSFYVNDKSNLIDFILFEIE